MKKGKVFGAEAEFESMLEKLEEGTAEESTGEAEEKPAQPTERPTESEVSREVTSLAAKSPKAALVFLSSQIERTIHDLVYYYRGALEHPMSDALFAYKFRSTVVSLDMLRTLGAVDQRLFDSIINFLRIRGMIIHEGFGDDPEILRAIDSGLKIYADLQTRFLAPPP